MKTALLAAVASSALLVACTPDGAPDTHNRIQLDQSTADAAIHVLGLSETGTGNISFDSVAFDDGVYTFSNVVILNPDLDSQVEVNNSTSGKDSADKTPGLGEDSGLDEIHAARMMIDSPHLNEAGDVLMYAFSMEDISLVDTDDPDTIITLERFGIEQPNGVMSAEISRILMGSVDDDFEPSWNEYEFSSLAFDALEVSAIDEGSPVRVSLDRLAISGAQPNILDRFELLGLDFSGEDTDGNISGHLTEFSIDGLDLTPYADMFDALAEGGNENAVTAAYFNSLASNSMDMYEAVTFRDLDISAPGATFAIDFITARMEDEGNLLRSVAEMGSMSLTPDATNEKGAQIAMGLGMMGYNSFEMSFAAESVYDQDAGRVYTDGDNYIEIKDALRIEFGQDASGYNDYFEALSAIRPSTEGSEPSDEDVAAILEAIRPLTLNQMSIRLEDMSLLERGLSFAATTQGLPPEQLRAQAGMMVGMGLMAAPPEIPRTLIAEFSTALTTFINEGGVLIMEMNPTESLSAGQIMDQIEAKTFDYDSLGLSFSTEPPAD